MGCNSIFECLDESPSISNSLLIKVPFLQCTFNMEQDNYGKLQDQSFWFPVTWLLFQTERVFFSERPSSGSRRLHSQLAKRTAAQAHTADETVDRVQRLHHTIWRIDFVTAHLICLFHATKLCFRSVFVDNELYCGTTFNVNIPLFLRVSKLNEKVWVLLEKGLTA